MGSNVFRLTGDILHSVSIVWLLIKLIKMKSCGGVSCKTQFLFTIVCVTRYLDLFYYYISMYNSFMKIAYTVSYFIITLLICVVYRKSYRQAEDTFPTELLLVPCFCLAIFINHRMSPTDKLWAFSIYLESVAILPQFYMIYKRREVERSLLYYLIPLGLYRLFYVFNWIYRYTYEGHFDVIADAAGLVYVGLYFFAIVEFWAVNVKVTDEEGGNFLKKNIFFITGNRRHHETNSLDENLLHEPHIIRKV